MKLIKTIIQALAIAAMPLMGADAPEPENVPELMKTFAGNAVESAADWEKIRAPEILERYTREVFGVRPKEADEHGRASFEILEEGDALDGKAIRKTVKVNFETPNGRFTFPFVAFIPKSEKPAPAFVLICNRPEAKRDEKFWPVKEIVARGYATASFLFSDVVPDDAKTAFSQGVIAAFAGGVERTDESWGTISAWAWAASRVMDWIETEPLIDAKRVGVVGHSRGGKTALWAGATDRRFAMVCSNDSGCSGAKLNHINLPKSETIAKINAQFPHWFAKNYRKCNGREREMDFDQHELLALVAPRLLCVASATKDDWAGQRGEWWAAKLASSVWELYGGNGLAAEAFPAPDSPQQDGSISYHLRTGKHDLSPYDWRCYMDFADRHGWSRFVPEAQGAPRYKLMERLLAKQKEVASLKGRTVDLVMIGDSITHFWESRNAKAWKEFTAGKTVLNLGYGGDTTQNVIWRIDHGELDGYAAKVVTIMIGTNNNTHSETAPANVAEAVEKIVAMVREKQPQAKIVLHAIFPRGNSSASKHAPKRARNDKTNALLKEFAEKDGRLVWLDLTDRFVDASGWVPRSLMGDEIHPSRRGYEIWAEALKPYLQ